MDVEKIRTPSQVPAQPTTRFDSFICLGVMVMLGRRTLPLSQPASVWAHGDGCWELGITQMYLVVKPGVVGPQQTNTRKERISVMAGIGQGSGWVSKTKTKC